MAEAKVYDWLPPIEVGMLLGHRPGTSPEEIQKIIEGAETTCEAFSLPEVSYGRSRWTDVKKYVYVRESQAVVYANVGKAWGWEVITYQAPDCAKMGGLREAVRLHHDRTNVIFLGIDADFWCIRENRLRNVFPHVTDPENIANAIDITVRLFWKHYKEHGLRFAGQVDTRTNPPCGLRGLGPSTKRMSMSVRQFHEQIYLELNCDVPWDTTLHNMEGVERTFATHRKYGQDQVGTRGKKGYKPAKYATGRFHVGYFEFAGHQMVDENSTFDNAKGKVLPYLINKYGSNLVLRQGGQIRTGKKKNYAVGGKTKNGKSFKALRRQRLTLPAVPQFVF